MSEAKKGVSISFGNHALFLIFLFLNETKNEIKFSLFKINVLIWEEKSKHWHLPTCDIYCFCCASMTHQLWKNHSKMKSWNSKAINCFHCVWIEARRKNAMIFRMIDIRIKQATNSISLKHVRQFISLCFLWWRPFQARFLVFQLHTIKSNGAILSQMHCI